MSWSEIEAEIAAMYDADTDTDAVLPDIPRWHRDSPQASRFLFVESL